MTMTLPNAENDLTWGYRFGELVNALIDSGCRMQSVKYPVGKPCIIKFFVRPGIRFILRYEVDHSESPGRIVVRKIAVVVPIGKLELNDDLDHSVSETAQQVFDWANTGKRPPK